MTLTNPGVAGMLSLLGIAVWMVCKPKATEPAKIMILVIGVLLFGPISETIMNAESRAFPLKFDYFLYLIDTSLGASAFPVAALFTEADRSALFVVYQSLMFVMMLWYVLHLKIKSGTPKQFLNSCLLAYLIGPCLYLFVPARGPRHVFGALFPWGNPHVSPVLVKLEGWPNAIPSLHLTTALLFLLLSGKNRVMRYFALLYLAATIGATLAFEHYVIDLIVAVPFACFVVLAAEGKFWPAFGNLAAVLAWLVAIRFKTPALMAHPLLLRLLACATLALPLFRFRGWKYIRGAFLFTTSRAVRRPLQLSSSQMCSPSIDIPQEGGPI